MGTIDRRRRLQLETLETTIAALRTTEGWQRWIAMRRSLPTYSALNQLALMHQHPDATHVAGRAAWRRRGREVCAGETPLLVAAPRGGRDGSPVAGFHMVEVFDVAQTEGRPLPDAPPAHEVVGDTHAHLEAGLHALAAELGYAVHTQLLPGGVQGSCDNEPRQITLDALLDPNARVTVLMHELAHALGVSSARHGRPGAEAIAEAAACIACATVGLQVNDSAATYIASWTNADTEVLARQAVTIDRIAKRLEAATTARVRHA